MRRRTPGSLTFSASIVALVLDPPTRFDIIKVAAAQLRCLSSNPLMPSSLFLIALARTALLVPMRQMVCSPFIKIKRQIDERFVLSSAELERTIVMTN